MVAKQINKRQSKEELEFVQVDAYMIPAPQAEMYRVLREAVAEDIIRELKKLDHDVQRVKDDDEGEAVVAYDENSRETYRIYLNPTNISLAQKARDKDQVEKFIANYKN